MITLKVKRLHPDAMLPQYQTAGAACFDLHALVYRDDDRMIYPDPIAGSLAVDPGRPQRFRTGLAFEVPKGYALMIYSRSGHGFNSDVRLSNCVGVIDSDFRGEVEVKLKSDGITSLHVRNGDRIAQAMLVPIPQVQIIDADDLTETERGTGGFGSTGA